MKQFVYKIILVAGALLVAHQISCRAARFARVDYIDLPSTREFGSSFHKSVRKTLLKLDIGPDADGAEVMRALKRASHEASSQDDKNIYSSLAYTVLMNGNCPRKFVALCKSIYAQMNTNELSKFEPYMQQYVMPKFAQCSKHAQYELNKFVNQDQRTFVNRLDSFFRSALDMEAAPEEQLVFYNKLKEFDFVTNKINVNKALEVVYDPSAKKCRLNKLAGIKRYLSEHCEFSEPVALNLDIINMASAFEKLQIDDVQIRVLNEFRRICLQWSRSDLRHQIYRNIRSRGTSHMKWGRKLGTLINRGAS